MSDSFADLWNTTTPAKSNLSAQSLASLSKTTTTSSTINNSTRRQNDLFSQLSSVSPSSSRSVTPGSNTSKPLSPPPATTSKVGSGGDAFSGLFSSSNGLGSGQSTANMTMAQRAAQAEKEKREKLLQEQAARKKEASAWEGLDSLGGSGMMNRTSSTNSNSFADEDDDWGFGSTAKASAFSQNKSSAPSPSPRPKSSVNLPTPAKSSTPIPDDDDWGLGNFGSSSASKPANSPAPASSNSKPQGSLWDLDAFNDIPPSRIDSPGKDFDFGDREDGPVGFQDDDILGDLGKPVDTIPKHSSLNREEQRPSLPPRKTPARSSSPPPHVLGQLVEMGFSIQQSRAALAATDTGEDVQAALEFLISNGAAGGDTAGGDNQRPSRHRDDGWGSDNEGEHPPLPKRPTPGRQVSNRSIREQERERSDASSPPNASGSRNQAPTNISEQADKLFVQASTIGMSLFNRANAAWKDGKERVQKAYEERVAANNSPPVKDGRPRWMQEQQDEEEAPRPRRERFTDEDGPTATNGHEPAPTSRRRPEPQRPQRQQPPQQEQEVDLFLSAPAPAADPSPAPSSSTGAYVSPFRHGRPKPKPAAPSPPQKQPHPMMLVLASTSALRSSATYKTQGNSHFKLGDFPSAEGAYTRAINALPSGHALLLPLLNNRALVRLKVGDSKGAIEDAGLVINMVSTERGVIRGGVDGSTTEDLDVNMGETIVKAWKRRAEAFESREKWEEAGKDWERVAGAEWAGQQMRSEGVRGAGRCRRALAPPPPKPKAPAAPPRPKPKVPTPPSQALDNLRAANIAAENEDIEKHALKDSVEAKLTAWKGGKETNIRALLASLDIVLWPELGVQKWGMSELVTEGQVKIKYMKAIAKVHPDKLSAGNFTVEQKMLAQGVFGALNEAWNAFKQ
ncbi:uba ts-n domain protein [Moniliophthora roreri MCA 2997]|uniref:Uba ts-n domain protein n=2 Tax=Moniliophthora roreri TaxID=221103 RepID=V2Z1D3_MONRO|nr:uba ts-n domain protein [Moniliophthora roreri MCA 2997]KAI3602648.1 uba ts-n domain protein [Moniliophthora roreri]